MDEEPRDRAGEAAFAQGLMERYLTGNSILPASWSVVTLCNDGEDSRTLFVIRGVGVKRVNGQITHHHDREVEWVIDFAADAIDELVNDLQSIKKGDYTKVVFARDRKAN